MYHKFTIIFILENIVRRPDIESSNDSLKFKIELYKLPNYFSRPSPLTKRTNRVYSKRGEYVYYIIMLKNEWVHNAYILHNIGYDNSSVAYLDNQHKPNNHITTNIIFITTTPLVISINYFLRFFWLLRSSTLNRNRLDDMLQTV